MKAYESRIVSVSDSMENEIEGIRAKYARLFLQEIKRELSTYHTLKPGRIRFLCGMGSASLMIRLKRQEVHLHEITWRDNFPIIKALKEIEDSLNWEWAAYLDGIVI
jgi:hypothetical protein